MPGIRPMSLNDIEDPSQFAVGDMRKQIAERHFREGLNIIAIDDDQVALTAMVENGRIVSYAFTDSSGAEVQSTLLRKKQGPAIGRPPEEECFLCRRRGDTLTCTKIPCI